MQIVIEKEINSTKLLDELLAAGLIQATQTDGTSPMQGNTLYLLEDADIVAIQAIIGAHDPATLPPKPTEADYLLDLDYRLSMIELGL